MASIRRHYQRSKNIRIIMGWTIVLEDENGQAIRTLLDVFNYDDLDSLNFDDFILLKYIDPYGDTTFNTLQLDHLQTDFKKLKNVVSTQVEIIEQILNLIKHSQDEVHKYIKFYGD